MLVLSIPLWPILYLLVKGTSKGPFIFQQKRAGLDKRPFTVYKIRTMVEDAEKRKKNLQHLNEANGPVFKIRNDPRYTAVGKILAKGAIDELPQLFNVLKGEMAMVGPRPLPLSEAKMIPKKYSERFSVLPGMTSLWIVSGGHKLKFNEWMDLDMEYVHKKSLKLDLMIFIRTLKLILRTIFNK